MKYDAMVGTSVRLPKSLRDDLEKIARQNDRSLAQLIRLVLQKEVSRRTKKAA